MNPLNSAVELGMRVLFVLIEAFPSALDVNRLVLLDHGLLHSGDLGGPESIHPSLPSKSGELGMKRRQIEQGVQVLTQSGLAEMDLENNGISFRASESADHFISLLESPYSSELQLRAAWVVGRLLPANEEQLREEMRRVLGEWSEEFDLEDAANALESE